MESTHIELRKAVAADMEDVLFLIRELAIFEKEPDAVEVTVPDLRKHFHENRFEVFLACADQKVVGMALFYERYSTWKGPFIHLEDLFVLSAHRGQSIGRMLLEAVIYESRRRGARRLGWEVLDWNTPAVKFYESVGASIDKEWWQCRMYRDGIENFVFSFEDKIKDLAG